MWKDERIHVFRFRLRTSKQALAAAERSREEMVQAVEELEQRVTVLTNEKNTSEVLRVELKRQLERSSGKVARQACAKHPTNSTLSSRASPASRFYKLIFLVNLSNFCGRLESVWRKRRRSSHLSAAITRRSSSKFRLSRFVKTSAANLAAWRDR